MPARTRINRTTVDLSAFPDLIAVYLGMKVLSLRGLARIARLGPEIQASVDAKPDGLLLHEGMLFSLLPLHVGMRQYWRMPTCSGSRENSIPSCSRRPSGLASTEAWISGPSLAIRARPRRESTFMPR